jgi:hypothetical protein
MRASAAALRPSNDPERRAFARRRTVLSGILVHGPSLFTCPCAILDISRNGAKVKLGPGEGLGTPLWLADLSHGLAFEAEIAWRREDRVGLRFTTYLDLAKGGFSEPGPILMRSLWIERQSR